MPLPPSAKQFAQKLEQAKNASELLSIISESGLVSTLSDTQAEALAASQESNNGELTAEKINATEYFEAKTGTTLVESTNDEAPTAKDIAAQLSSGEIKSTQGFALLHTANNLTKQANEAGEGTATEAKSWLQGINDYLADGGSLNTSFTTSAVDRSFIIAKTSDGMVSNQTNVQMFVDYTDPGSQRQASDVISTESSMQDSE